MRQMLNAADFAVWRNLQGQAGAVLAADADDNNVVNAEDYNVWRSNLERTIAAATSATSVPEPTSAILLLFGAIPLSRRFKLH